MKKLKQVTLPYIIGLACQRETEKFLEDNKILERFIRNEEIEENFILFGDIDIPLLIRYFYEFVGGNYKEAKKIERRILTPIARKKIELKRLELEEFLKYCEKVLNECSRSIKEVLKCAEGDIWEVKLLPYNGKTEKIVKKLKGNVKEKVRRINEIVENCKSYLSKGDLISLYKEVKNLADIELYSPKTNNFLFSSLRDMFSNIEFLVDTSPKKIDEHLKFIESCPLYLSLLSFISNKLGNIEDLRKFRALSEEDFVEIPKRKVEVCAIKGGDEEGTFVTVRINDNKYSFMLRTTNREEIISEIMKTTGISREEAETMKEYKKVPVATFPLYVKNPKRGYTCLWDGPHTPKERYQELIKMKEYLELRISQASRELNEKCSKGFLKILLEKVSKADINELINAKGEGNVAKAVKKVLKKFRNYVPSYEITDSSAKTMLRELRYIYRSLHDLEERRADILRKLTYFEHNPSNPIYRIVPEVTMLSQETKDIIDSFLAQGNYFRIEDIEVENLREHELLQSYIDELISRGRLHVHNDIYSSSKEKIEYLVNLEKEIRNFISKLF